MMIQPTLSTGPSIPPPSRERRPGRGALRQVAAGLLLVLITGCQSLNTRGPHAERPVIFPVQPAPEVVLAQACDRARAEHKRVLLCFGANWCGDSQAMYRRLTEDPRLAPLVREHYILAMIDVGERHGERWNGPLVERYGQPFEGRGIPALVVAEADGRQVTDRADNPLKDSDHRRPRKVQRFLETWIGSEP